MSAILKHPKENIKHALQVEEQLLTVYFCGPCSCRAHAPMHGDKPFPSSYQPPALQGVGLFCAHCWEPVDTTKDHAQLALLKVKNDPAIHYFATEFNQQPFEKALLDDETGESVPSQRLHLHYWKHEKDTCYYCSSHIKQHGTNGLIEREFHPHKMTEECQADGCRCGNFYHIRSWLCTQHCMCNGSHLVG